MNKSDHEILEQRARELATPISETVSLAQFTEVISFRIGDESFAIETQFVREVLRAPEITFVPNSPSFLLGVSALRGTVLAVMDIGEFLHARNRQTKCPWLLVVGTDSPNFGMAVESVDDVSMFSNSAMLPPASESNQHGFIKAVTSDAITILDGEQLLSSTVLDVS